MYTLTTKQHKMYSDLVQQHGRERWEHLGVSLQSFLERKREAALQAGNYPLASDLHEICQYADNDF